MTELATDFNNFFSDKVKKICAKMNHEFLPNLNKFAGNNLSELEPFIEEEILMITKDSAIKTSPDDILPCQTIKENLEIMVPSIVTLVNKSLDDGSMDGLKLADIVPLLKGGSLDHNSLKNFHPVSNLQFIGKIIERVLLRRAEA